MSMEKLIIYQPGGGFPDPHLWVESSSVLQIRHAVYEGLLRYDAKTGYVPVLADNWVVSEDAREWLFILRKGVHFHDGSWVTASDAASSIRNASRKDAAGAYGTSSLLYSYLGEAKIEVVDAIRVRIILPEPMADLPDLLSNIMVIPEKYIGADPVTIPGTGPFRLDRITDNSFRLLKNDHYWGNAAQVSELNFVKEENADLRVKALTEGSADIVTDLNWQQTTEIDGQDEYLVIEKDPPVSIILMLNCASAPFTDIRVRQALNYGTDVDEIIQKACKGAAVKLNGPFTPHHFGYDPHTKPYPYDTGKAWQLLAEAGYADGLELTLYCPTMMPNESGMIAKNLKEQWARIGVKLNIVVQPDREQYSLDVRAKKIHDLCIFDSAPLSTYRVLHEKLDSTVKGAWWEGYDSPELNDLLRQAAQTVDTQERENLYREAIRLVREEAPWVFLYSPVKFIGTSWEVYEQFPELLS